MWWRPEQNWVTPHLPLFSRHGTVDFRLLTHRSHSPALWIKTSKGFWKHCSRRSILTIFFSQGSSDNWTLFSYTIRDPGDSKVGFQIWLSYSCPGIPVCPEVIRMRSFHGSILSASCLFVYLPYRLMKKPCLWALISAQSSAVRQRPNDRAHGIFGPLSLISSAHNLQDLSPKQNKHGRMGKFELFQKGLATWR